MVQVYTLTNIKKTVFLALNNINKKAFFFHAETEGFEPSVELPLHTLSKRAPSATWTSLHFFITISSIFFNAFSRSIGTPSATWTSLHFFTGWQKYSFNIYNPNIFSAFTVVTAATSSTDTLFINASFSTIYFK
jgi:hypothetical protein